MKYISFAIPSYNSQEYMSHAIESILVGGEDVEIIIVNDGSSDDTSKIAHEYEEKYPTIIKAVDKENGGHGDAVNSGLTHATGKYFKVVDSDDWVDAEALQKILEFLKKLESEDAMFTFSAKSFRARFFAFRASFTSAPKVSKPGQSFTFAIQHHPHTFYIS